MRTVSYNQSFTSSAEFMSTNLSYGCVYGVMLCSVPFYWNGQLGRVVLHPLYIVLSKLL